MLFIFWEHLKFSYFYLLPHYHVFPIFKNLGFVLLKIKIPALKVVNTLIIKLRIQIYILLQTELSTALKTQHCQTKASEVFLLLFATSLSCSCNFWSQKIFVFNLIFNLLCKINEILYW